MKVLFINVLYPPHVGGGAEITLKNLVHSIKRQGHEVVVLSTGPGDGLSLEEVEGVRVYRAESRNLFFHLDLDEQPSWKRALSRLIDVYNPLMADHVKEIIAKEKPDVVSCHNLIGWSVATWKVLANLNIPIVQVLHDHYLACHKSSMYKNAEICLTPCLECRLLRMPHAHLSNKVTAVVGVSEYILNRFLSLGYFKDTPLKYAIHNTRNFAGNGNSAPKADDQIVFGYIGSLAKHKGIELLLKTFEASQQANWHLKIAGKGAREYENDLMTRYRNPRIEFLGHQSPDDFFPMLDVSIVPSLWNEPLGMVVAESLLYGIPVIASNRGGIPEMIEDKNTGVIFDPAIPNSFENALAYMAQNIRGFREHKDAIKAKASRFSDQDAWAAKWLEIYKTALSHCSG